MSFSDGFASGASVGNQIQQRLLAKELRKLENARYEDEKTYSRGRDATRDAHWKQEFDAQEADRAANRAAVAKRLGLSERELAQREAIARVAQGSSIMSQFGNAMNAGLDARKRRAEIDLLKARAASTQAGGNGGWATTEEIDPLTGEVTSVKRTSRGIGPAPSMQGPQEPIEAGAIMSRREKLLGLEKKTAAGDNYWGPEFLGLGKHRAVQAQELRDEIDALSRPQPSAPTAGQQRMSQMPQGVQAQFAQVQAQQPAAGQPPAGTIAQQNGKRYRFDGQRWTEIQ